MLKVAFTAAHVGIAVTSTPRKATVPVAEATSGAVSSAHYSTGVQKNSFSSDHNTCALSKPEHLTS
jgi:hypothetical protein